ncbi:hypothetical protein ABZ777_30275 [Micromonospora parva]|uniref:hypothetical protein n=1 Tax=Micromonospora parva TaxID=1464048 RepID=UPI0033C3BE74
MRDDPTLVEQIQRDLQDVRWLGPEEIRARARRRSQRRIVAATVVLALAGVSAAAVAAPRTSPPSVLPAASASPTRHEISTDALLQPTDLTQPVAAPKYPWQLSQSGLGEPVRLDLMLGACRMAQGYPEGWQMSILSRSQTLLREHPAGPRTEGDALVEQDLFRLTPEAATQLFTGLDDLVAPCAEWRQVGELDTAGVISTIATIHRWRVTQRDFAGDDAAMVLQSFTAPRDVNTGETIGDASAPIPIALVRVGDTVSVLRLGYDGTEAELRKLAVAAAARMCAAANPPC